MLILFQLVIICLSTILFALLNASLQRFLRPPVPLATGFLEWKWRNIVVSLIHSAFSGLSAFCLTTDYILSDVKLLTAFDNRILGRCTLCISVGYFLYDSLLSISQLGKFPGRVEIIVHHVITTLTLCLTLFDIDSLGHFLAFCVFGMVIEINNIFIHIRSLMQMAHYVNNQKSLLLYKFNSICALVSVFAFRFVPLYWISNELSLLLHSLTHLQITLLEGPIVAIILISVVICSRIIREDFLTTTHFTSNHVNGIKQAD